MPPRRRRARMRRGMGVFRARGSAVAAYKRRGFGGSKRRGVKRRRTFKRLKKPSRGFAQRVHKVLGPPVHQIYSQLGSITSAANNAGYPPDTAAQVFCTGDAFDSGQVPVNINGTPIANILPEVPYSLYRVLPILDAYGGTSTTGGGNLNNLGVAGVTSREISIDKWNTRYTVKNTGIVKAHLKVWSLTARSDIRLSALSSGSSSQLIDLAQDIPTNLFVRTNGAPYQAQHVSAVNFNNPSFAGSSGSAQGVNIYLTPYDCPRLCSLYKIGRMRKHILMGGQELHFKSVGKPRTISMPLILGSDSVNATLSAWNAVTNNSNALGTSTTVIDKAILVHRGTRIYFISAHGEMGTDTTNDSDVGYASICLGIATVHHVQFSPVCSLFPNILDYNHNSDAGAISAGNMVVESVVVASTATNPT